MVFRLAPGEVVFSNCDGIGAPFNAEDADKPWRYEKNIQIGPITEPTLHEKDPTLALKYEECRAKLVSVARWIRTQMFETDNNIRLDSINKAAIGRPDLLYEGMHGDNKNHFIS